jgi:DNA-binding SARP family transcriptional activator/tetratricopeptide (TPR) repeat protein
VDAIELLIAVRPTSMRLRLSERLEVEVLGGAVQALSPHAAALLAWLAVEGPTPRGRLAALLWPGKDADAARNSLRQRLFQIKRQFGADLVVGSLTLALADGVQHDLDASHGLLGSLDGGSLAAGEFAHWLHTQRSRRQERVRRVLTERCERAELARAWDDARVHARELLALDPLSEGAHRLLIRLHYLAGDRAAALLAFDACERVLKDEVGTAPSPETLALLDTVEQALVVVPPSATGRVPAAVLRPPRLIGRATAWQALEQAWADGRCAVVTGEAGMGKTRLCTDFAASRLRVLASGGRPGDERVVYATLSRLLRALPRAALDALDPSSRRDLARLLPELGPAEALLDDIGRTRFFNAVVALFDSPALDVQGIVIDDLHFADDASIELLQYVAAASSRCWLVGARSAELSDGGRALLQGFQARGDMLHLALPPLALAEVAELVDSLGLTGFDGERLAPALLRRTGGNPLFLLEALKAWLTAGTPVADTQRLPPVHSVAALIEQRIGRLSTTAVQLARCAAVAAPDFGIELASQVLGLRTLDLADPWAELEAAQVLRDDGAFVHDLIYESALASVPKPVAHRLHAEIAAFLHQRGGEPARIAAHWLAADEPSAAFDALLAAAAAAATAMRVREQAGFLQQAADLAEQMGRPGDAFDALHAAERAYMIADRTLTSDALLDRLDVLADTPQRRLTALLSRADVALNRGSYVDGMRLGEAAARLARQTGDAAREVDGLRFAAASASHSGDNVRAVTLLRPALPWVLQHGDDALQQRFFNDFGCCLDHADMLTEGLGYHQRALDLAVKLGRLDDAVICCTNRCATFRATGDLNQALEQLQRARGFAAAYDQVLGSAWTIDMMSFSLLRDLGRYGDALRGADLMLQSLRQHPSATPVAHGHLACLWIHLGQHARAQQALNEAQQAGVAEPRRGRHAQLAGRLQHSLAQDAHAAFAEARAKAPLSGRLPLQLMVELDHALVLDAESALAAALQVRRRCEETDYGGVGLAASIRACHFALRAGDVVLAVSLARRNLVEAQRLQPDDLYPAELWLHGATAFAAAGDQPQARACVAAGQDWVMRVAREQVPDAFRDSFLHRNPVNRELLAL